MPDSTSMRIASGERISMATRGAIPSSAKRSSTIRRDTDSEWNRISGSAAIFGRSRGASGQPVAGAGHERHLVPDEGERRNARVLERQGDDGELRAVHQQVLDEVARRGDLGRQLDPGMGFPVGLQDLGKQVDDRRVDGAEAEPLLREGVPLAHPLDRFVDEVFYLQRVGQQGPALQGEIDSTPRAVEQPRPEKSFQLGDPAADGRLGDAEVPGRPGETACPGDRQEIAEVVEVHGLVQDNYRECLSII